MDANAKYNMQEAQKKGIKVGVYFFSAAINEAEAVEEADWVSQYPQTAYPDTPQSSYEGTHAMWQYTNNGRIAGIDKNVDLNVAYFGYEDVQAAKSGDATESVSADPEANMNFTDVNETVTAKESVNLRDIPGQGSDSIIKSVS